MTILEMIAEWRKGCSNTNDRQHGGKSYRVSPVNCSECTIGLIESIEARMQKHEGLRALDELLG